MNIQHAETNSTDAYIQSRKLIFYNSVKNILQILEFDRAWTGKSENVVPSATNRRHRSPSAYFCNIVRQAASLCLATSTPVTVPELPRSSDIMHSLAPEQRHGS